MSEGPSEKPPPSPYCGMTTNERLFAAGIMDEFDAALRSRDRARMIELLIEADVLEPTAQHIADGALARPVATPRAALVTPAPSRRWFRFSLRTLFVVVTICAIVALSIPALIAKYREWERDRGWKIDGTGRGKIGPFESHICE